MPLSPRPNILWISLEDTSPRFGCWGDPVARTPHIDRLAAGGCRFPNAFSVAGVCAPSRAAIITGMHPTAIGAQHMRTSHTDSQTPELPTPYETCPPHYVHCFPEYLRAAGYFCTNNEKTDYQFNPPFTTWDEIGKQAHWRNRPDAATPFFAVFNPTVTHESGMWPKDDEQIETDPSAVTLPPYLPDTPKARLALARHYDNIAHADARVGELLDQLEADQLTNQTIVFLWSDHGEGLPRAKRWPYDAGIRVPLIVRIPDLLTPNLLEPGCSRPDLVSLIDLAPTVLSLANVPIPAHFHGQAFLGSAAENASPRRHVFATRDRHDTAYDMVRAVRDDRFKYMRHYRPDQPYLLWIPYRDRHPIMQELWRLHAEDKLSPPQDLLFQPRPVEELYDTHADPFEMHNLATAPAYQATIQRLRETLNDWREKFDVWGDVAESEMVARWYPHGQQPQTAAPVVVSVGETGDFTESPLLRLHCPTQGASIGYQFGDELAQHWRLYTRPIRLPADETTLRAKAIRIGYHESPECVARFPVG